MARTRVRWGRVGALLAGAGVAMTLVASAAQAGSAESPPVGKRGPEPRTHLVRPGDTLWGIARRLAGPGADPRPVVDELARTNDVRGALRVGTRLVLPS